MAMILKYIFAAIPLLPNFPAVFKRKCKQIATPVAKAD